MTSILDPLGGMGFDNRRALLLGEKIAKDRGEVARNLRGQLKHKAGSMGDWIMLSVPNAMVHGVFQAMDEPGIELPSSGLDKRLDAHISVIRPDEVKLLGGPEALKNDRGKTFRYTLGRLVEVNPRGWPEMERCWFLRVHSPELQALRRSYGLSSLPKDGEQDFHITVAVRRRGILGRNTKRKELPPLT